MVSPYSTRQRKSVTRYYQTRSPSLATATAIQRSKLTHGRRRTSFNSQDRQCSPWILTGRNSSSPEHPFICIFRGAEDDGTGGFTRPPGAINYGTFEYKLPVSPSLGNKLPNPTLAQSNPELKKKTELKYSEPNFSPDEVRSRHPKYYFAKDTLASAPEAKTDAPPAQVAPEAGVAAAAPEEARGKKRARAEDFL